MILLEIILYSIDSNLMTSKETNNMLYSTVPNKRRGPNSRGLGKNLEKLISGGSK